MKLKFIQAFMETAHTFSKLSHAQRKKVGCVIVKGNRIISIGYNGTPSGWDNVCEDKEYMPVLEVDAHQLPWDPEEEYPWVELREYNEIRFPEWPNGKIVEETGVIKTDERRFRLTTRPEVIHAEMNAISKVAQSNESCQDAIMFCTLSPCIECAKMILQSGIGAVYYDEEYKNTNGIEMLEESGLTVHRVTSIIDV